MLPTDGIPFAWLCKPGERYLLLKIAETGGIYKKNQMLPPSVGWAGALPSNKFLFGSAQLCVAD